MESLGYHWIGMKCDVFSKNIEMPELLLCWYQWIFSPTAEIKEMSQYIGLTVVRHNSADLFHLQAAGHFSFQKHWRFQLMSSASDWLEVVSSFESQTQVINQFLVYLLRIPSVHYLEEIGLHVSGLLKEQFWTLSRSLKVSGSLKVLGSLKVPYKSCLLCLLKYLVKTIGAKKYHTK